MISADEWRAYNAGVSEIADGVEREVTDRLLAWHSENPAATVAETREYAKLVMNSTVQSYDGLAATFAAEWYDYQAERVGAHLKQAVTASVYAPKSVDEAVRYQAKKLTEGDFEGFAKTCGEYARNDSLRSLNETILANAKRDSKEGVRFARIPAGTETCTFCLMLASRGAVYYSRKTAGDFKHFHRRCDCKVVPGFKADPDAELVEGYRPKELRKQWGRFEEIDNSKHLNQSEKATAKRSLLGVPGPQVVYRKPVEAFEKEKGGKLDLAAHEALRDAGHEVVVREESAPEGCSNIDLLLNGRLCELKSPTSDVSGANGLRFIERNIRKAIRQFHNTDGGPTKPIIIALNCETVPVTRDDAVKRTTLEMNRHSVDIVYLITKGGVVDKIENRPQGC